MAHHFRVGLFLSYYIAEGFIYKNHTSASTHSYRFSIMYVNFWCDWVLVTVDCYFDDLFSSIGDPHTEEFAGAS